MLLTFVQTVIDVCVCSLHCCEYQSYLSVSVFGFCLRVRFRLRFHEWFFVFCFRL
jgi:hypothetical protein